MSELKPCPFCGSKAMRLSDLPFSKDHYGVCCSLCSAKIFCFDTQEHADEMWNRRYGK